MMKFLNKLIELINKIIKKDKPKQIPQKVNENENNFIETLKVSNQNLLLQKPVKTDTIIGCGLGFQNDKLL